jgi:hypothetical protein
MIAQALSWKQQVPITTTGLAGENNEDAKRGVCAVR